MSYWWFNNLSRTLSGSQTENAFLLYVAGDPESVAGEYGRHTLYKMLGYFSLVGLLRLHSLLGDYYQAIKVLENIELNKKVKPSEVLSSNSVSICNMFFLFFSLSEHVLSCA